MHTAPASPSLHSGSHFCNVLTVRYKTHFFLQCNLIMYACQALQECFAVGTFCQCLSLLVLNH